MSDREQQIEECSMSEIHTLLQKITTKLIDIDNKINNMEIKFQEYIPYEIHWGTDNKNNIFDTKSICNSEDFKTQNS